MVKDGCKPNILIKLGSYECRTRERRRCCYSKRTIICCEAGSVNYWYLYGSDYDVDFMCHIASEYYVSQVISVH